MLPVTVRVFNINFNCVMTKFLDMNVMKGKDVSTAAAMFKSVDDLFSKFDLNWEYITSIGVDNTNSNVGQHNLIASRAKEKTKKLYLLVVCAMCYITLQEKLQKNLPVSRFDFKDHCVSLFF